MLTRMGAGGIRTATRFKVVELCATATVGMSVSATVGVLGLAAELVVGVGVGSASDREFGPDEDDACQM